MLEPWGYGYDKAPTRSFQQKEENPIKFLILSPNLTPSPMWIWSSLDWETHNKNKENKLLQGLLPPLTNLLILLFYFYYYNNVNLFGLKYGGWAPSGERSSCPLVKVWNTTTWEEVDWNVCASFKWCNTTEFEPRKAYPHWFSSNWREPLSEQFLDQFNNINKPTNTLKKKKKRQKSQPL